MKNRNALLGLVIAVLLTAGIVWWVKQTPAEKPVVEFTPAKPAPAKPATQVAMPVLPPKSAVVAPTLPAAVPSTNPQPAATPVAAANPQADLNTAVSDLISTLQSGDVNGFVQNYMAPSMMEMAKSQVEAQFANNPNVTPEIKARAEQALEQRMPTMIQQLSQEMSQRPDALQGMQKMAAALQSAQATPPQMNDAGDRATYTLQTNGDKDLPASLIMVRQDGKWSLDFASMVQAGR